MPHRGSSAAFHPEEESTGERMGMSRAFGPPTGPGSAVSPGKALIGGPTSAR